MILDRGIAVILRRRQGEKPDGNLPEPQSVEIYRSWYGERVVGMSRFYAAQQAGSRCDLLIRLLAPPGCDTSLICADDVCRLPGGKQYRILQAQYLHDDEAGADCVDLSLERIVI